MSLVSLVVAAPPHAPEKKTAAARSHGPKPAIVADNVLWLIGPPRALASVPCLGTDDPSLKT
ncbi:MAG TPA: hypothetical protein VIA62_07925 [Thermoanaerobaculia bacterium]|jgi:hypothetical protein|nr:hypothetical protein [Thermoanaerobaculia bacterium]